MAPRGGVPEFPVIRPEALLRRTATVAALGLALLLPACRKGQPSVATPAPKPVTVAELQQLAADPEAAVVLVNVWATWCAPCREELPALVRLHHEMTPRGVKIVLVSADFDQPTEKLVDFLASQGVDFPTWLKTESDAEFMKALEPDWSGAIPASFLYRRGKLVDFWEGKATYQALVRKVQEASAIGE